MHILIAIDSFKGCLSSMEVAAAVAAGIKKAAPQLTVTPVPVADGGEGTVEAVLFATGGRQVFTRVTGPLRKPVAAFYGLLPDGTAVIEMAAAAGLGLVPPDQRQPAQATTYGVGELIKQALAKGCRRFIIGLGGSATNDAGIGMLTALGWRFLDKNGRPVDPVGATLRQIARIDEENVLPELAKCRFTVINDVSNPLTGPEGATHTFAAQKGADPVTIAQLEEGMRHFAGLVASHTGSDKAPLPGSGAAGGLGFALAAFLQAQLQPAAEVLFPLLKMQEKMQAADLVITGEGRLDSQTANGKLAWQIARLARQYHKPAIALAGEITPEAYDLLHPDLDALFAITNGPLSRQETMRPAVTRQLLSRQAGEIIRLIQTTGKIIPT